MNSTSRANWDIYFMMVALMVARRSTCLRRQVGAVIVDPLYHTILSTGYNGAPRGHMHCGEPGVPCLRLKQDIPSGERLDLCRAVHSEINAIGNAAKMGTAIADATMYVTVGPCPLCIGAVVNAGISRIVTLHSYHITGRNTSEMVCLASRVEYEVMATEQVDELANRMGHLGTAWEIASRARKERKDESQKERS